MAAVSLMTVRQCIVACIVALCAVWPVAAFSAPAQVTLIEPLIGDNQLTMDVDFAMDLNRVMVDAVEHGVPLHFTVDLTIKAPRWWWLDRVVVDTSLTRRLTYNTLTRQWRVASGDLFLPVGSLDEAMAVLRQVRGWPVAPLDQFDPDFRYEGRIRIRLDTSQLSRPLRVDALAQGAWSLVSPWKPFDFSIRQADPVK